MKKYLALAALGLAALTSCRPIIAPPGGSSPEVPTGLDAKLQPAPVDMGRCRTKVYVSNPTDGRVAEVLALSDGTDVGARGTVDVFRGDGSILATGEPIYILVMTERPGSWRVTLQFDGQRASLPVKTGGC